MGIDYLTVLGAGSLTSRCCSGCAPSGSTLVSVLQRNRPNSYVCVYKEMKYKEMVHMIMGAEKSQYIQLTGQGPRRAKED